MTSTTTTPERTCIGCRSKRPQAALLRVVVDPSGAVVASRTARGRGAWLCPGSSSELPGAREIDANPAELSWSCLELAKKRRGFERAFRRSLGDGALDQLTTEFEENNCGAASQRASDGAPAEERIHAACVAGKRS